MIKHYDIQVFGRVQGVWFRKYTQQTAQRLKLSGWVRNEPDGSVRISVEGPEDVLTDFLQWCQQGSPESKVEEVAFQTNEVEGMVDFRIK